MQEQGSAFRRLLAPAEAITLVGMVACVFSLFFVWERYTPSLPDMPAGALFGTEDLRSMVVTHTGINGPVRWPLILCALLAGATLLWTPPREKRLPLAILQGACGAACVILALTHFAPLPGVIIALIGGALIVYGAVERAMR